MKQQSPKDGITPAAAAAIRDALAAVASASEAVTKATSELTAKTDARWADKEEIERLEQSLTADDDAGLARLGLLRTRLPFYDKALDALTKAVDAAQRALDAAQAEAWKAIGAGGRELAQQHKSAIAQAIAAAVGGDQKFAAWAAERAPVVVLDYHFATSPAAAQLPGMTMQKIAECVLEGRIPATKPAEREDLARVLWSASPAPQVSAARFQEIIPMPGGGKSSSFVGR